MTQPLYANPPHRVTIYKSASARDSAGGTNLTYSVRQAAVPCSIATASGSEQDRFSQMNLTITHRVAFLSSTLTDGVLVGDKLVADDTGDTYHVRGISRGRSYGTIPAFTYVDVEQLLGE